MKTIITNRNNIFWETSSMVHWHKAFLPEWVYRLDYSSCTKWVKMLGGLGGLPSSHLGKSNLKKFMYRHHSMKLFPGGIFCVLSDWANAKNGPPYAFFNKTIVKKSHRCGNEGTSES